MRHICGIFKNNTSTEFKIRKLKLIKDNKLSKTFTITPQQNIIKQYLNIQNIYIYIKKPFNDYISIVSKVRSAV